MQHIDSFHKLRIKAQFHQTALCIESRPCFFSEFCRCPSLQLHFLDVFGSHECNEQSRLPNSNWSYENREHQLEILQKTSPQFKIFSRSNASMLPICPTWMLPAGRTYPGRRSYQPLPNVTGVTAMSSPEDRQFNVLLTPVVFGW